MPRNSPIRIWMRENALWKASFDILSDAAGGVCRLETERHRGRHPLQRSPPLTFVLSKAGNLPCFSLYRTHVDLQEQLRLAACTAFGVEHGGVGRVERQCSGGAGFHTGTTLDAGRRFGQHFAVVGHADGHGGAGIDAGAAAGAVVLLPDRCLGSGCADGAVGDVALDKKRCQCTD